LNLRGAETIRTHHGSGGPPASTRGFKKASVRRSQIESR
jgi:hypothetical protein